MFRRMWSGALVVMLAAAAAIAVPAPAQAAAGSTWLWVPVSYADRYVIEAMLPADTFAGDCTQYRNGDFDWNSSIFAIWRPDARGFSEWLWDSYTSTSADSDDIWWSQFELWSSDGRLLAKTADHPSVTMTERNLVYLTETRGLLLMSVPDFESTTWIRWLSHC